MGEANVIDGVDYGPLSALVGEWHGDKGMDVSPEPDGPEQNPFYETIIFEPIGGVTNAESQQLVGLRYHQVVSRKSNDAVFHNETGYWLWDAAASVVIQTLTIPRGVSLVAGGRCEIRDGGVQFVVRAAVEDEDWGIVQSPFMREHARTVEFTHTLAVVGDTLTYDEVTELDIYNTRFSHTDANTLTRGG